MPTQKQKSAPACWRSKSHSPQKNSWLALRAAREKTARMGGNFPKSSVLVREKGLEPSRREALVPKTSVSTNSTTRAYIIMCNINVT